MNIGLFSDTYLPEVNGVVSSTDTLRHELEKHGHNVVVVTTKVGLGSCEWDGKVLRLAGIELKFLYGYSMTTPVHMKAFNEIRKLDLDIIHVQTEFGVGMFAFYCAKHLNIPIVYTYHTTYEDYTHYVNPLGFKRIDNAAKGLVARLSRRYGDSSTEIIVPSAKTKEMLLGYKVKHPINVVPTGLNIKRFDPSLTSDEQRKALRESYHIGSKDTLMVFVGRIAQEKNIDMVIDAFKILKDHDVSIKLLIVGGGPEVGMLEAQAKSLNLEDRIIFAGKKPASEVPQYYHISDGFISASMTETQGMTFVEALASGLMVFAKDKAVLADLVDEGNTGYYFNDKEELAELLSVFANMDADTRKSKRQLCIDKTHNYDEDIFYENVMNVYQKAMNNYKHEYEVERINAKDDVVELTLDNGELDQIKLMVSYDLYFNIGLRKGQIIDEEKYQQLKEDEIKVKSYLKCIRYISRKDRSEKEIREYLYCEDICEKERIDSIVECLKEHHYLDDNNYTLNFISSMRASLQGKNRIVRALKKKGISDEIINNALEMVHDDDEFNNAYKYALKVASAIHGKSVAMKKKTIYQRMVTQGYSGDVISSVIDKISFADDETNEIDNLKDCAIKAKRHYEKKYKKSELRNNVFKYCMNHGFKMEDIYAVLDEMEWDDIDD